MSEIEPGWYKDPAEPTTQRYWDGEGWIGAPLPIDATPPPGPPPSTAGPAAAAPPGVQRPAQGAPVAGETPGPTEPPAPGETPAAGTGGAREAAGRPQSMAPTPPPAPTPTPHPVPTPTPHPVPTPPPTATPPPTPPAPPTATPPPTPTPPVPGGTPGAPWPPPGVPVPPGTQPPPGYPIHPAYARLFAPPPRPHGYPLADVGRRLTARLVDVAVLLVINALVNGWFVFQFVKEFWPWYRTAMQRMQANLPYDDVPQPQNTQGLLFTITAIAAALWFAYEVPALANSGQTFGKRLLGIKVLRLEADGPLGFGRAWRRWNPMGIATLLWTCGIGFVLQFIDCLFVAVDQPLHQALHDKAAATVVVDVKHEKSGDPR